MPRPKKIQAETPTAPAPSVAPSVQREEPKEMTIAEMKARGSVSPDSEAKNKARETIKRRKLAGDKHVPWNVAEPDCRYELAMEIFGDEQLTVAIRQTLPRADDFGRTPHINLLHYADLMEFITKNCWSGEAATFVWSIQKQGWHEVANGTVQKQENPEQRVAWMNRCKAMTQAAAQSAAGSVMQQPSAPQVVVQPASPVTDTRIDLLLQEVASLKKQVSDKPDPDDEEEEEEPEDEPRRQAPPTIQTPAQEPQMMQYEQVKLQDGSIGYRPVKIAEPPPASWPEPPEGYIYQKIGGDWRTVPIQKEHVPPPAPAPTVSVAPAPATTQQVPAQPPPPAQPMASHLMADDERRLMQEKFELEKKIAVIQARIDEQNKSTRRDANETPSAPAPVGPSLPPPPPGYGYSQINGQWVLQPLASAAPPPIATQPQPPPVAEPGEAIKGMVKQFSGAKRALDELFGSSGGGGVGGGGGFFPKAGEAGAESSASSGNEIPLKPMPIGGDFNWFWNTKEDKAADGFTQALLNGPGLVKHAKDAVKDIIGEFRKLEEERNRRIDEKYERDKRGAQQKMRELDEEIRVLRRQAAFSDESVRYQAPAPSPSPSPASAPEPPPTPEPVVEQKTPASTISSMAAAHVKWGKPKTE